MTLRVHVQGHCVSVSVHPNGKYLRAHCDCDSSLPCSQLLEAATTWPDSDNQADDEELERLDHLQETDERLAEAGCLEDYVRDLADAMRDRKSGEAELDEARAERDREERTIAVEFAREQIRDHKETERDARNTLKKICTDTIRVVYGRGERSRKTVSGWLDEFPDVDSDTLKSLEQEFFESQLRAAELQSTRARFAKTTGSSGCGASAALMVAVGTWALIAAL